MKLRSLDKDGSTISLGSALLLLNGGLKKNATSTSHRLDFYDENNRRWLSIGGTIKEIEVVTTLFHLVGPAIVSCTDYKEIPESFKELRKGRISQIAWREGIVYVLDHLYSIQVPDYWESDGRAFNKWLGTFELPK